MPAAAVEKEDGGLRTTGRDARGSGGKGGRRATHHGQGCPRQRWKRRTEGNVPRAGMLAVAVEKENGGLRTTNRDARGSGGKGGRRATHHEQGCSRQRYGSLLAVCFFGGELPKHEKINPDLAFSFYLCSWVYQKNMQLNYPKNFEKKIHFDQIRDLLKTHTLSSLGSDFVDQIQFETQKKTLLTLLGQVAEMREILVQGAEFPTNYYIDVRGALNRLRTDGTFLDTDELFDFKRSIETIVSIVQFIEKQEAENCVHLKELIANIETYPEVYRQINQIITKTGTIKDSASAELRQIRMAMFRKQQSVSKTVNQILRKAQENNWSDTDSSPAIRGGRLVVPVSAAYKRKIAGIVHDESATGKTSYIEPTEVVELNNELRELGYAERREIVKILVQFAESIRPYIDEFISAYDFLGKIDLIRAKAKLALVMEGVFPEIDDQPCLNWKKARHPLLYLAFKEEKKELVPLSIELGEEKRMLVISGPNAGGKSVCLKTVGLLQYMLQCGLFVPVEEDSEFGLFEQLFIDIGDEQSLEDDLSTYSSHIANMRYFTEHVNEKTLILIDEFGTGTEPSLGGAIAESVLEELNEKQAFGVITTHYANLKHYASQKEGILNGAMLYDNQLMTPLYRLQIGAPGSSFAFEIAHKMGLSKSILNRARAKVGREIVDFDHNLKTVAENKVQLERKVQSLSQKEVKLDKLTTTYAEQLKEIKQLKKEVLEKAKQEAEKLLQEANKTIEKTIRTITENKANKSVTRTIRQKYQDKKEDLLDIDAEKDQKIDQKIKKLQERDKRKKNKKPKEKEKLSTKPKIKNLEVGDLVKLPNGATGELLEITKEHAVVALGALKSTVKLKDLKYVSRNQKKQLRHTQNNSIQEKVFKQRMSFKADLDVRGMRAGEAIEKVTEHVDNALILGVGKIQILHGTGHGILRKLIRDYLSKQPDVSHFQDAHVDHGGAGITLVDLD